MPQQLIYTSAPRGVVAGRSGHCTVARSSAMREALMLQLEKMSYYQHLSLSGGQERPIYSCRVLDIRGSRYHVLSRIQDAGLDFTGRTNFLAHHLVFAPEELRRLASPPVILRAWTGWVRSWSEEPQMLENEAWSGLAELSSSAALPATNWQQITGDAANGYGLLDSRVGTAFRVDNLSEDQILALFAESLELLELRDPRRDFRATAWQYTFTTSMQEQDNPADFRWRCLHSDNPASSRFAGPDCRPLSDLRAQRTTGEERTLARSGRQPPRFVLQPQNVRTTEGETARLQARAEGVPSPSYQWFTVDRAGNGQAVANGTNAELTVQNPPLGVSRYVVRANNSQGDATSEVATLSVEPKPRLAQVSIDKKPRGLLNRPAGYVKSADQIERQRRHLEAKQAEAAFKKKLQRKKFLVISVVVVGLAALGGIFWGKFASRKNAQPKPVGTRETIETGKSSAETNPPATYEVPGRGPTNSIQSPEPAASAKSAPLPDTITTPPPPWKSIQIGSVAARTSALVDGKDFIVNGAGDGINGKSDNFFFLHKPASNSVDFVARLHKANKENKSRHGIMIRESENADAAFAFVGLSQTSIFWLHRDKSSTNCQSTPKTAPHLPVFLRLLKMTDSVSGAFSSDGSNWTWLGTNQVAMPAQQYLVGLAVSSGTTNTPVQAQFDEVNQR